VPPVRSASGERFSLLSGVRETDSVTERILLDENTLLGQLEELARSLGIEVRYEPLKREGAFSTGGLCKLRGEYLLIIHSKASVTDKIEALASALKRFDLSQLYLRLERLSGWFYRTGCSVGARRHGSVISKRTHS
jgi:hypothetical protein